MEIDHNWGKQSFRRLFSHLKTITTNGLMVVAAASPAWLSHSLNKSSIKKVVG